VTSNRLTAEDWIGIARKALIASGVDDVKVDVLARRLKVTRGSFYWHFKSRQQLLDALLRDWEENNRREIETLRGRAEESAGEFLEVFRIWLKGDPSFPAFDVAVRVWARKSRAVAKVVSEIDDAWIAAFQDIFELSGLHGAEAFVRARIMYFHQIGYYAVSINESLAQRAKLAPIYYAALTGRTPPEDMEDALLASDEPDARSPRRAN